MYHLKALFSGGIFFRITFSFKNLSELKFMSSPDPTPKTSAESSRDGLLATGLAFSLWGLLPVYWKLLAEVPSFQILCHRTIWSLLFLLILLLCLKRLGEARAALRLRRNRLCLAGGALMLAANWGIYIWAVTNNHLIESSLGYYITPLVNVVLGRLVFKDRLKPPQIAAVALALAGVLVMLFRYGHFPWLALCIAVSFGLYGMCRKLARVEALPGLFLETVLLSPFMLAFLVQQERLGLGAFLHNGAGVDGLLLLTGVVTSVPLLLFVYGARRISFITVGLLQYITPTMGFILGCFVYGEAFTPSHVMGFGFIWAALALYTFDGLRRYKDDLKNRQEQIKAASYE